MQKNVIIIGAIVIIAVAGAGWFIWRQVQSTPASQTTSTTTTNMPGESAMPSPAPAADTATVQTSDQTVAIKDMAFSPSTLKIKKGVKVTWTNQDSLTHSVVADSSSNSGGLPTTDNLLDNGQSYSHTFDTIGTFSYHCGIHPSMTGSIEVVE